MESFSVFQSLSGMALNACLAPAGKTKERIITKAMLQQFGFSFGRDIESLPRDETSRILLGIDGCNSLKRNSQSKIDKTYFIA